MSTSRSILSCTVRNLSSSRRPAVETLCAGRTAVNSLSPRPHRRALHSVGPRRAPFSGATAALATPARVDPVRVTGPGESEILRVNSDEKKVNVEWPDGRWSKFHNRHLFDHCRCEKCFHGVTRQRLKTLSEIPSDIHAREVSSTETGVHVKWSTPEPHESFYPYTFLRRASYDPVLRPVIPAGHDRILWNSTIPKSPPTITYESITSSDLESADRAVLQWLTKVHEFGICFVTGVPVDPGETKSLIERMGMIRETHYGGFWDFTADLSMGDLAYSDVPLPAHTDNTYFTDPSGLQCFHLLSHPPPGTGGHSLLVDGFYTASILKSLHPDSYAVLSELSVPSHASGSEGTMLRPPDRPVLVHDPAGELIQVRWNNEDRGVLGPGWTAKQVEGWYTAAGRWEESVRSEDAEYWVKLAPGTMVVIDNWRVMHGRSGFTGKRRMCGAYVGRDEWRSRLEVLRKRFEGHRKGKGEGEEAMWEYGW